MSRELDTATIDKINQYDAEKRLQYSIQEIVANREVWILTDADGCVMLNTEDEDCVPVWPNKEFAMAWTNEEWADCQPEAISLNKWHSRWSYGLEDDDLFIVVFPDAEQEGVIISPQEFDFELKKQAQKR